MFGRQATSCIANGVRFHTTKSDGVATQNCGLAVKGNHDGDEEFDFYGRITDIIELKYIRDNQVILFKCECFDIDNKKKVGRMSERYFTSINSSSKWYKDDPFVLPLQAKQVFYVNDMKLGRNWLVVQEFQARHIFDVPEVESADTESHQFVNANDDVYQENKSSRVIHVSELEVGPMTKDGGDPNIIDVAVVHTNMETIHVMNDATLDDDNEEDETLDEYYESSDDEVLDDNDGYID